MLVHADIFKPEVDEDAVFSKVIGEFHQLKSEVLDEFRVDIWDPGFDLDGYIFEEQVETGVFFEELLQFDQVRVDETLEFFGLEEHVLFLERVKLNDLADHYFLFL